MWKGIDWSDNNEKVRSRSARNLEIDTDSLHGHHIPAVHITDADTLSLERRLDATGFFLNAGGSEGSLDVKRVSSCPVTTQSSYVKRAPEYESQVSTKRTSQRGNATEPSSPRASRTTLLTAPAASCLLSEHPPAEDSRATAVSVSSSSRLVGDSADKISVMSSVSQASAYSSLAAVPPELLCSIVKSSGLDMNPDSRALRKLNEHTEEFRERFNVLNEHVLRYYSCALSLRILLHGRLYVTENFIGFFSAFNDVTIFGLEPTTVLVPFSQIVAIRKRNTALIFPNSIEIELLNKTVYFFASFLMRDKTYDFLVSQWTANIKLPAVHSSHSTPEKPTDEAEAELLPRLSFERRHLSPTDVKIEQASVSPSAASSGCEQDADIWPSQSFRKVLCKAPVAAVPFPVPPTRSDVLGWENDWIYIADPALTPSVPHESLKFVYPCARWNMGVNDIVKELMIRDTFLHRLYRETGITDAVIGAWSHELPRRFQVQLDTAVSQLGRNFEHTSQSNPEGLASGNEENLETHDEFLPQRPQRSIKYQRPMKRASGFGSLMKLPPYATVDENWIFFIYSLSCIMVQSTIQLSGVPYSNCFHVVLRYRFTEIDVNDTQFDTEMAIVWDRSTLLKRKIESTTISSIREGILEFTRLATEHLYNSTSEGYDQQGCLSRNLNEGGTQVESSGMTSSAIPYDQPSVVCVPATSFVFPFLHRGIRNFPLLKCFGVTAALFRYYSKEVVFLVMLILVLWCFIGTSLQLSNLTSRVALLEAQLDAISKNIMCRPEHGALIS